MAICTRPLFLDQSGHLGGAELCLLDIVKPLGPNALVCLLADGPFRQRLEAEGIAARVVGNGPLPVRKNSGWVQGASSIGRLLPMAQQVADLAQAYDLIYANTPKALIVGALASALGRRPLVYHLHDIISPEHFSATNRRLLVFLANRFAQLVIANSEASKAAFVAAGGQAQRVQVVYNGFDLATYDGLGAAQAASVRRSLDLSDEQFVVGHFSRLSPWKGQHLLIEALPHCPDQVVALLVGDALFGEDDYVQQLHQQVQRLNLGHRVRFLGFRADVPQLMAACDLVAHTSTAPEPFGRVIVEAMLCGRPVIAAQAGGAVELIGPGRTGWLCPPGSSAKLAELITHCVNQPERAKAVAANGQQYARQHFDLSVTNGQIHACLAKISPQVGGA
jgi:glycosyltransferase involved in cell wall biosynthesis